MRVLGPAPQARSESCLLRFTRTTIEAHIPAIGSLGRTGWPTKDPGRSHRENKRAVLTRITAFNGSPPYVVLRAFRHGFNLAMWPLRRDAILALKPGFSLLEIMRPKSLLILSTIVLAACAGSDPAQQVETAKSWTATSILIGERWLNRSVPDNYSIDALTNAAEELSSLSDALHKTMKDSSQAKAESVILPIRRAGAASLEMARQVRARNAPGFSIQLDSLRSASRQLENAAPGNLP